MLKPVHEIIYQYTKGIGWVPVVVREDVRHTAKKFNFSLSAWVRDPGIVPVDWGDDF